MTDSIRPGHQRMAPQEMDRNGLVMLDRDECLRLLGTVTLGRIGLTSGALPAVLPVNFWFDGKAIYLRTGPGTKLSVATRDAVVAFEVDEMDPLWHTGWSVMVTGIARHVIDPDELESVSSMPIAHWAPRGGEHVISITPELVSGRRIQHGPAPEPIGPTDEPPLID